MKKTHFKTGVLVRGGAPPVWGQERVLLVGTPHWEGWGGGVEWVAGLACGIQTLKNRSEERSPPPPRTWMPSLPPAASQRTINPLLLPSRYLHPPTPPPPTLPRRSHRAANRSERPGRPPPPPPASSLRLHFLHLLPLPTVFFLSSPLLSSPLLSPCRLLLHGSAQLLNFSHHRPLTNIPHHRALRLARSPSCYANLELLKDA